MTTTIEDNQLDSELHELHTISKLWISELEMFDQDVQLLRKQCARSSHKNDLDYLQAIQAIVAIDSQCSEAKRQLIDYLQRLEPLIDKTNSIFPLSIIEEHALIECEMVTLLHTFRNVKATVAKLDSKKRGVEIDH